MAVKAAQQTPYKRYYCRLCHDDGVQTRVFPYDGFEALTEVNPKLRAKNGFKPGPEPVLLYSENGRRAEHGMDTRLGWCWRHNKMVECFKYTYAEVCRLYLHREGVDFRVPTKNEREFIEALDAAIQRKRGL